ncbi:hypothetical protein BcepSauron_177 [Burkholderia phage BcepSauron]|uniref:Uncharacterized protein n=1 Tax=Burkholderia phage BcepSauron TaxID=2530033 RepID=A0A482MKK1_9CAUD|nr:hypothetical protein H1O17_gp177 [Burkholderia phage BcepSauron]QBQ74557.1 hypothetical protein BcepSauron_177 [Burkholderia phage BcepSauron]
MNWKRFKVAYVIGAILTVGVQVWNMVSLEGTLAQRQLSMVVLVLMILLTNLAAFLAGGGVGAVVRTRAEPQNVEVDDEHQPLQSEFWRRERERAVSDAEDVVFRVKR